jgi:hypothetical protein
LLELSRKSWKKFAVSGIYDDKKDEVRKSTDVDGRSALGLFKLAGFDTSETAYLMPNQPEKGRVHVDMGSKEGFIVNDDGKTAYFDHHSHSSKRGSSATEKVYETLTALGALNRTPELESLVKFVNAEDNRSYAKEQEYFRDSYRNLLGLSRFMSFGHLYDYFKSGRDADTILTKAEISKLGLEKQSNMLKANISQSFEKLKELEKNGFIVNSPRYGKIVVDVDRKVSEAFRAAKAYGAGGYLIWSPYKNSMFFSTVDTPIEGHLPQGRLIRETMWIKPRGDKQPLTMNLQEVLNILTQGKLKPTGELAKYLAKSGAKK